MISDKIIEILRDNNKYISTMESCTGGEVASSITNVSGASDVFKFGAVTYSNEFKIKMGVDSNLIDKYSVYSEEVSKDMAYKISNFTNSNYGIGVTGKINRADSRNMSGSDSTIFITIYDRDNDKYYSYSVEAIKETRLDNKKYIVESINNKLLEILGG